MDATKTGSIRISRILSTHTKKAHIFDVLQSASLISLGQLCDNDCIAILDKNKINILKKYTYFKDTHKQDKWFMGHTHIKTIETSRS